MKFLKKIRRSIALYGRTYLPHLTCHLWPFILKQQEDSLKLWREVCGNKLLARCQIILFLNKKDVLAATLEAGVKVTKYVPTFGNRANDVQTVTQCTWMPFGICAHVIYVFNSFQGGIQAHSCRNSSFWKSLVVLIHFSVEKTFSQTPLIYELWDFRNCTSIFYTQFLSACPTTPTGYCHDASHPCRCTGCNPQESVDRQRTTLIIWYAWELRCFLGTFSLLNAISTQK